MNLGYTGKPYDTATGLYNYGYRDYKPEAARFTTVDPIRDGVNWFAYVNNDPLNWIDPCGLLPDAIWDVASIVTGVVSMYNNIRDGDIRGSVIDGLGIIADIATLAVPGVPGGVGIAVKSARTAKNALQTAEGVVNTVKAVQEGDMAMAAVNAVGVASALVGVGGDKALAEAADWSRAAKNAANTTAIASASKAEEAYKAVGTALKAAEAASTAARPVYEAVKQGSKGK
jgi:RHS repeat-associated protein